MQYSKDEEAPPPSFSELPELNECQMRFVVGLSRGLSAAEAYRQAYDTTGWQTQSIYNAASRLKHHPDVQAWLAVRRIEMVREMGYSRQQFLEDLEDLKQRARASGKLIAEHQAIQTMGKAEGYIGSDKQDDPGKGKADGLLAQIRNAFGEDAAQAAAKKLGLETGTVH